ncbi:hypothetical protein J6O86_01690 [bacterium]|nr:hypothetical protein [bacterium]
MRRFLIAFLLLIQSFLLCVNAGELNLPIQNSDKHIEYIIKAQTTPVKTIGVDFKNYENALISLGSKTQEIFAHRNSNNFDGIFIGFFNSDFKNEIKKQFVLSNYIYSEFHNISSCLKYDIHTRAP